jgi:hypothetical protein
VEACIRGTRDNVDRQRTCRAPGVCHLLVRRAHRAVYRLHFWRARAKGHHFRGASLGKGFILCILGLEPKLTLLFLGKEEGLHVQPFWIGHI